MLHTLCVFAHFSWPSSAPPFCWRNPSVPSSIAACAGGRWDPSAPGAFPPSPEFPATPPLTTWARRAAASGRAPAAGHMEAHLRRHPAGIHRLDRHRALQPQHRLRGHGRRQQRGEIGQYRQRRMEVGRRRRALAAIGLDDTNHVVSLVVDPKNPDIVLAAALGHTYARNEERGVFRTTDGGRSWTKVLYKRRLAGRGQHGGRSG